MLFDGAKEYAGHNSEHVSGQISTTYINPASPSHVLNLPEVTFPNLKTSAKEAV
jgi:hypothetical protein